MANLASVTTLRFGDLRGFGDVAAHGSLSR
jgi:hypothetical protein